MRDPEALGIHHSGEELRLGKNAPHLPLSLLLYFYGCLCVGAAVESSGVKAHPLFPPKKKKERE